MKIDVSSLAALKTKCEIVPGNIYPAQGGKKPGTDYWLVVAVSNNSVHLIGFNADGEPVSTASYLKHAIQTRPILGCVKLPILELC